jgi:hypothetical protein
MDIDHTSDGTDADAETTEVRPDQRPAPPADRPGTDGYLSRAESRLGAAAANETATATATATAKPETGEEIRRQEDATGKPESGLRAESTSVIESSERREQSGGSATIAYDATTLTEADVRSVPGDSSGPSEDAGAPDASVPDVGDQTDGSDAGDTSGTLGALSDVRQPSRESDAASGDVARGSSPTETVAADDADAGDGGIEGKTVVSDRFAGERLLVGGKPLREHLDPAGAAAWSSDISDPVVDPEDRTGARIADTEKQDLERDDKAGFEAFRKRFNKERESLVETAGKSTSRLQDIMGKRPPSGHLESRTGPEISPAPVQGLDAGDVLTTGLAVVIVAAEAVRKLRGKLTRVERG